MTSSEFTLRPVAIAQIPMRFLKTNHSSITAPVATINVLEYTFEYSPGRFLREISTQIRNIMNGSETKRSAFERNAWTNSP